MKHLLIFITLFIIVSYGRAQEENKDSNKNIFYLNIGGNIAAHNKEGYQVGLSFGKNKHIFQLQFIESKAEKFSTDREGAYLNAILKVKAYSITYNYVIWKKGVINIIPSGGITAGQEFYRTDEVEFLGYYGCGGWFCSSNPRKHYKYNYKESNFIGAKASLIFQAYLKQGFAGISVEHYIIINNHNRYDFGITVSLSLGKLH